MRTKTFLKKAVAGLGSAAFAIVLSACAHHNAATDQYGQIRTEAPASADSGQTVGTAPAPNNTAGVGSTSTPAVISGPAAVDSSGRAYTSSSVGSAGNSSVIGTNTDVNLIPKKTKSEVTVAEVPAPVETPVVVETPAPAPVVVETPVVETPAPAPVIETPAPMSSSTETPAEKPAKHRRMRKD